MTNYYNDIDPSALAWLRELMNQGHIPQGVIDGRSIKEIKPEDVAGEGQRHFFAGIGGWPLALRIAGWPASRNVWTGSCPCQPYSSAGKRKGSEDERDLWPDFYSLIRECKPETVFGEQVASSDVVGTELEASFVAAVQASDYSRANRLAERIARVAAKRNESIDSLSERWLDRICTDMEAIGYTVGAVVLGAHSVGAPHQRQRLYWFASRWVAHSSGESNHLRRKPTSEDTGVRGEKTIHACERGGISGPWSDCRVIQCRDGKSRRIPTEPEFFPLAHGVPGRVGLLRGYGNAIVPQVAAAFVTAFLESTE